MVQLPVPLPSARRAQATKPQQAMGPRALTNRLPSEAAAETFFASLVHEIRTPLTILTGFSELLVDGSAGELNSEQQRYLDHMRQATESIRYLVDDMLEFVRMKRGSVALSPERLLPAQVLGAIAEAFMPTSAQRGIRLKVMVSPSVPGVHADPHRLKQILGNLLTNALKFTPSGGTVTLSAHPRGAGVVFTVSDTGIGIDPDSQTQLFESFYQVQPAHGSTGLGLRVAKQLVEAHDGHIRLDSEPGSGTTFTFTLPCAPDPSQSFPRGTRPLLESL